MATAMAKVYYSLIKEGRKSIEDVPQKLRDEVERMINESNQ